MNIHGVGAQQQSWQVYKHRQENHGKTESGVTTPQSTPEPSAASTPAEAITIKNQEKGVVRLLQEGHFQGVADVRLRINFHEELQQAASRQAEAAWASNTQDFMASLTKEVNDTMAGFADAGAIDPLLESFAEAAAPFLNGGTDGPFDLTAALAGLSEAFNDLFSDLNALDPAKTAAAPAIADTEAATASDIAVPESEPEVAAADAPPAAPPTAESGTSDKPAAPTFAEAIAKLQQWFDQETAKMQTTPDGLLQPPEPSAPRGKGVAYERFLAAYHSLYATGNGTETDNGTTVDGIQAEA